MSLKLTVKSRIYDPDLRSIIFYAMDGSKPVPCAVAQDALLDMGGGSKQLSSVKLLLLFDKCLTHKAEGCLARRLERSALSR